MTYTKKILVATDRLINVLFGGKVGETLSSRAWREGWAIRPAIDALFFWEKDHCKASFEYDRDNRDFE